MKTLFIALTIASIFSQVPHAYAVFDSFSKLKGWLKNAQSIIFCGILSIAIFGFVLIGRTDLALLGAIIEIIINIYYYSMEFWKDGYGGKKKIRSTMKFWRQKWISIFFAFLLPVLIFIFSQILKEL